MKVHAQVTTGNDHEASGEDRGDISSTGCAQPRILIAPAGCGTGHDESRPNQLTRWLLGAILEWAP